MYERFSDRARKVMQLANQEAQRFRYEYIGTEQVLLGLVRKGRGVCKSTNRTYPVEASAHLADEHGLLGFATFTTDQIYNKWVVSCYGDARALARGEFT